MATDRTAAAAAAAAAPRRPTLAPLLLLLLLLLAACCDLSSGRQWYDARTFKFDEDVDDVLPEYLSDNEAVEWVGPQQAVPPQRQRVPAARYELLPERDFSYTSHGGADNWPRIFPGCRGNKQSPINVDTFLLPRKPIAPLIFKNMWDNENAAILNNTGKTAKVVMASGARGALPTVRGGPLRGSYTFDQLHFHWGRHDLEGSEHSVNLLSFSMEAHMVFYKSEYSNMEEAAKHDDGFAVLAFLLESKKHRKNKLLNELVHYLPKVRKALSTVQLPSAGIAFRWLQSHARGDYATYWGSLTTPPCTQAVTWLVYTRPCFVSAEQVNEFRLLKDTNKSKIKLNYRPLQRFKVPDIHGPLE